MKETYTKSMIEVIELEAESVVLTSEVHGGEPGCPVKTPDIPIEW